VGEVPGLPWGSLSHRQVLAELAGRGWLPCGVGDWAMTVRSPAGGLVARVCPFDPAYWAYVDLCRQCAGNPWLPRIELATALEGGGSVVFLEWLAATGEPMSERVAERWRARADDADYAELGRAAWQIDARYRRSTPWWGRCDLDSTHHLYWSAADHPVLIDIYCMAGSDLYGAILDDVAAVHHRIPREQMRYALDIPYIARESSVSEIRALRSAWARVTG